MLNCNACLNKQTSVQQVQESSSQIHSTVNKFSACEMSVLHPSKQKPAPVSADKQITSRKKKNQLTNIKKK